MLLSPSSALALAPSAPGEPDADAHIPGTEPASPGAASDLLETSLDLTPDQEKTAADYLVKRIDELRKEMGLSVSIPRGGILSASSHGLGSSYFSSSLGATSKSWAGKRERNDLFYQGNVKWRADEADKSSVFKDSNHTLNIPARFARLMSAQLDADQLSTEPFCAFMPQPSTQGRNGTNADLAKAVERYLQGELSKSNVRDVFCEAGLVALYRNEATVKPSWTRRTSSWVGEATVLVNAYGQLVPGPDGQPTVKRFPGPRIPLPDGSFIEPDAPFVLPTGEHIYENDDILPLRMPFNCQATANFYP